MAVAINNNKQWDVDADGCACIIQPGIPTSTCTKVPSSQLDQAITRHGEKKARLTAERDRIQAKLDEITQQETDLIDLRTAVTTEP